MYTEGFGAQDGVNSGTATLTGPCGPEGDGDRTWTHSSTEGRSSVRMLLSFQRPSHLSWEGCPPKGTPGTQGWLPGRTDEYSAGSASPGRPGPAPRLIGGGEDSGNGGRWLAGAGGAAQAAPGGRPPRRAGAWDLIFVYGR